MIIPENLEGKTAFISFRVPLEYFNFFGFIIPNLSKKWIIEGTDYAIVHSFVTIKYGTPDGVWIITNQHKDVFGPVLSYISEQLILGVHLIEKSVPVKDIARVGFVQSDEINRVQYLSED